VEWNSYTKRIDYITYKRKKRRRRTAVDIDRTTTILAIISQGIVILEEAIVMYSKLESNYYALHKSKHP
jgi:beta-lactamase regulating signal transducer with metallopeptidase domain